MKFNIILISILLVLSSCGYSMRGAINVPSSVKSVSVMSNYYSELVNILNESLISSNIDASISKSDNIHRITILSEKYYPNYDKNHKPFRFCFWRNVFQVK